MYVLSEYLHQEIRVLKTEHAFVVFLSTHFIPIAAVCYCQYSAINSQKTTQQKSLQVFLVSFLHAPRFRYVPSSSSRLSLSTQEKKEKGVDFTIQIAQEP